MNQSEMIKEAATLIYERELDIVEIQAVINNLIDALDITKYKDVNTVADEEKISPSRVRQLAKELKIGSVIGGLFQFTEAEQAQIKKRNLVVGYPKGRPYAPRRLSYTE